MNPSKLALNIGCLLGVSMSFLFPSLFACKHTNTQSIIIQEATCEQQGIVRLVCSKCDEIVSENTVNVLGHSYGEYVTLFEPSPNQNGSQKRTCTICGAEEISPIICPHEDYLIETLWSSTCFDAGRERRTCQSCFTVSERDLPLQPHAQTAAFITKDSSCSQPGVISHVCTECFSIVSTEEIPSISHSFGEWMLGAYATPWEAGHQYRICSVCGYQDIQEEAPVELHDNMLYIPTLGVKCDFGVGQFTQAEVNAYDVLYTDWAYRCEDANNPFLLGHNYGSLGKLYNLKVGGHVYLQVDNTIYDYVVVNSEYAVEYDGLAIVGQTTGVSIWDTYSGALNPEMPEPLQNECKDRRVDDTGRTLHMYTCYYGSDKPEWKSAHGRNGRWIVVADLIDTTTGE